jgi:hypothetical protein
MEKSKIDRIIDIIRSRLNEDVPVNALAHGQIAGTKEAGDNPPVRRRNRYITNGHGSRKIWLDYLRAANVGRN